MKFTPGRGRVTISAARDWEGPDLLRVCVADTGPGIDEATMAQLFQRLHQGAAQEQASRRGLGLGLFISRELVTRQGGRIWAESEPGRGSRFIFTVPSVEQAQRVAS